MTLRTRISTMYEGMYWRHLNRAIRVTAIVIIAHWTTTSHATTVRVYKNGYFEPFHPCRTLSSLSTIVTAENCLCQCANQRLCSIVTHFGYNQTCILFAAQLNHGQLRLTPTVYDATVYTLPNRNGESK